MSLGILACTLDPAQAFTLTNTGNVPLTGIAQGVLGGTAANDANWTVDPSRLDLRSGGGRPTAGLIQRWLPAQPATLRCSSSR